MKYLAIAIILLQCFMCSAQMGGSKLKDKIYYGPGFGINFNRGIFNGSLSPFIGYKITERYSAGITGTIQYLADTFNKVSNTNYGGGVFNRFILTEKAFLNAEYEYLIVTSGAFRRGYSSLPVGAGFVQPLGGPAKFNAIAMYNVLHDNVGNSPYPSPWILRAGISFGF
ncbi:MAG: hypothetical protein JXQ90_16925 [Cyclobacteriaceae bacterium]